MKVGLVIIRRLAKQPKHLKNPQNRIRSVLLIIIVAAVAAATVV